MIIRIATVIPFVASFVIVMLTDGGVYPGSLSIAAALMALSLALAAATAELQKEAVPLFASALTIWLLLVVWTLVQISPWPGGRIANDAFGYLSAAKIEASSSISVVPGDSLYSLLPLSLAFMTFLTGLLLFRSDRQAEFALRVFAVSGSVLALFAIIQFKLFPGTLMFSAKLDYLSSLTAPFVNRNTAATFYGLVLIALVVCLALEVSRMRSSRHAPAYPIDVRWLFGAMTLVVLLALALTTSRGGIGASIIAVGGLSGVLLVWLRKGATGNRLAMGVAERRKKRFLTAGLVAAVALLTTIFLFGRTLFRASMLGGEDGRFCVYPGIVKSIGQNWITGTGAGSFEYVFPAHADPVCGMTSVWIRAHNGYFDMALAYGVPITAVVLMLAIGTALRTFAGGVKRRKSKRPIVWGGLASVILVVAHSVVDFSIQIPGFAMAFMLFLAISMKISVNKTGII